MGINFKNPQLLKNCTNMQKYAYLIPSLLFKTKNKN